MKWAKKDSKKFKSKAVVALETAETSNIIKQQAKEGNTANQVPGKL